MFQPFEPVQPWTASASRGTHTPLLPACISHMLAARRRSEPCDPDTASHTLEESCPDKRQRAYLACHTPRKPPICHGNFWRRHCPISVDFMRAGPWVSCELRRQRRTRGDAVKRKKSATAQSSERSSMIVRVNLVGQALDTV